MHLVYIYNAFIVLQKQRSYKYNEIGFEVIHDWKYQYQFDKST